MLKGRVNGIASILSTRYFVSTQTQRSSRNSWANRTPFLAVLPIWGVGTTITATLTTQPHNCIPYGSDDRSLAERVTRCVWLFPHAALYLSPSLIGRVGNHPARLSSRSQLIMDGRLQSHHLFT